MARSFQIPPDTSAKEKIVGGVLTAGQLIWVIGGLGIAAGLTFLLQPIFGIVGVIFSLIVGLGIGGFMCFYKKHDIEIFKYWTLVRQHKRKVQKLPHVTNPDSIELGGDF